MPIVHLDGEKIHTWDDFHHESKHQFGFPSYYGNNLDAWVDCLSYLRDSDNMTKFKLKPYEKISIEINHSAALKKHIPELIDEISYCVTMLNEHYEDYEEAPALELILK